jgi:hypothetical protein
LAALEQAHARRPPQLTTSLVQVQMQVQQLRQLLSMTAQLAAALAQVSLQAEQLLGPSLAPELRQLGSIAGSQCGRG